MCGPRAKGLAWAQRAGRPPHLQLMSGAKLLNPLMTLLLPNNKLMSIGKPSPSALYLFFFLSHKWKCVLVSLAPYMILQCTRPAHFQAALNKHLTIL